MSDHCEEQEMEAEALSAIFDTSFEVISDQQPFEWKVQLLPIDGGSDDENFVGISLLAKIPLDYPESSLPELDIEIVKGLTEEHRIELKEMAEAEAANNEGMPAIYAICEVLREWLADHNTKGLDDASMYAQMMRQAKEEERKKAQEEQEYESQKQQEQMTEAEKEEQAVLKRRAEGTPCTRETFDAWKASFDKEMAEKQAEEKAMAEQQTLGRKNKEKIKVEDKSGRLTGFAQFSNKQMNMEAIEAAAEEAENDEIDPDELDVDVELFDDDEDLDDLDFDSDEDDDEDDDEDEEEQPDI